MLLGRFKEPPSNLPTGVGGGPCKGRKPASEGTGQAEACLTRPAINARENSRHKKSACSRLWRYRARTKRVPTPGHGIDRDRADFNVGGGSRARCVSAAIGPDRVKTQQTMAINFRGFSQRLGGRRRPNQAQSIILVAMALSASVRLLEGGTSRRTGLRPSSLPSGHRCPTRSTRV